MPLKLCPETLAIHKNSEARTSLLAHTKISKRLESIHEVKSMKALVTTCAVPWMRSDDSPDTVRLMGTHNLELAQWDGAPSLAAAGSGNPC